MAQRRKSGDKSGFDYSMSFARHVAEKETNVYDPLEVGSIDANVARSHDKAIMRAISTSYRPNKSVTTIANRTLFIGRLNPDTDEDSLKRHFAEYGRITNSRLVRDIVTGYSKCYAFVEFAHKDDMRRAHRKAHESTLDGKQIIVEYELERRLQGWKPRRLGGGLGGKKGSGQLRFGGRTEPWRKPRK